MKKVVAVVIATLMVAVLMTGCTESEQVSYNIGKEADNFNVTRKLTVINARRAKTLYDNYKLWCKSNGYYVCSMKKFNAELMAHPEWYEQKSVSGGVAVYYGIMMKTTG